LSPGFRVLKPNEALVPYKFFLKTGKRRLWVSADSEKTICKVLTHYLIGIGFIPETISQFIYFFIYDV